MRLRPLLQLPEYNVHRWDSPAVGRYTRPDPAPFSTGIDICSYARQGPLRLVDPLGLTVTFVDPRLEPLLAEVVGDPHPLEPRQAGLGVVSVLQLMPS